MRNHTYLLDHHQRSHYDTITIWTRGSDELGSTVEQPVGKLVQQSRGEVQHSTFSQLTQPNPNQSVIDRGNLINCLKTSVLSMLTMEQGNLLSKTAQVHTH